MLPSIIKNGRSGISLSTEGSAIFVEPLSFRYENRRLLEPFRQRAVEAEDECKNGRDRNKQVLGDDLAGARGKIDGARKLWIFENRHRSVTRQRFFPDNPAQMLESNAD